MKNPVFKSLSGALAVAALSLAGCGTEEMETGQTEYGVVHDSPIQGLSYRSGSISGETDSQGRFSYHPGSAYTFSLGALTLATISANDMRATVTPGTMVASYPVAQRKQAMIGLTRFFLTADYGGNPDDGIYLFPSLAAKAGLWGSVPSNFVLDFGSPGAATVLAGIREAYGNLTLDWESETTAVTHLNKSMACAYSGLYYGLLPNGERVATVMASDGVMTSYLYTPAQGKIHEYTDTFVFANLEANTELNRKELTDTEGSTVKLRYSHDIRSADQVGIAVNYGGGYPALDRPIGRIGWADAKRRFAGGVRTASFSYGRDYVFIVETYGSQSIVSGTIISLQTGNAANMVGGITLGNLKATAALDGRDIELSGQITGADYSQNWAATITETISGNPVATPKSVAVKGCSPV